LEKKNKKKIITTGNICVHCIILKFEQHELLLQQSQDNQIAQKTKSFQLMLFNFNPTLLGGRSQPILVLHLPAYGVDLPYVQ